MNEKIVALEIDGVKIEAHEGATILEAASSAGIDIPNLCFLKGMSPYGACGVCVGEA